MAKGRGKFWCLLLLEFRVVDERRSLNSSREIRDGPLGLFAQALPRSRATSQLEYTTKNSTGQSMMLLA